MELISILIIFAIIIGGVFYLSTTEKFQGVKTQITAWITTAFALVQANLPDLTAQLLTVQGKAWVFVGLALTIATANFVSKKS